MYIANSLFTADGVVYYPGDVVPELENHLELVETGYIIGTLENSDTASQAVAEDISGKNGGETVENSVETAEKSGKNTAGTATQAVGRDTQVPNIGRASAVKKKK